MNGVRNNSTWKVFYFILVQMIDHIKHGPLLGNEAHPLYIKLRAIVGFIVFSPYFCRFAIIKI